MTSEEILVTVHGQMKDIRSLEKRMDKQEAQNEVIQDLVISVKEMAINMTQMLEELRSQGIRLDKLEQKPAESWSVVKMAALTSLVSGIVGFMIGNIL